MGRPPSHGGSCFRFNAAEVSEMEAILQAHNCAVPEREILETLAQKFRRYALRAKAAKAPTAGKLSISPTHRDDPTVRTAPQPSQPQSAPSLQSVGRNSSDNSQMEFEAKSTRDGAWTIVSGYFYVHLFLPILEGKEQALYFDAQVLDAQRRRHDVRGCRCRFLVRYDHDQAEVAGTSGNPQIEGGTVGMPEKQPMPKGAGGTGATSASVPPTYVSGPDHNFAR
ncbi:Protein SAWADEE HOMEODOMAIN-like protein 2 [Forsythia ovata]|uniref:Protein SAWADEE HOMEODOMAIN-like protein 2 n=1 Tax=Forsythia ovata TaxID=205694 RepID=A0ABD1Q9I0_9LAMI